MKISNSPTFAKSFYEAKNCAVSTVEDVFSLSARNSSYAKYAVERELIAYRKYSNGDNLKEWNCSPEIEKISHCTNSAIRSLSSSANVSFSALIEEDPKAIESLSNVSTNQIILATKKVHSILCGIALSTPEHILNTYLFGDLDVYRPLRKDMFWRIYKNELSYFARYLLKCDYSHSLASDKLQQAYYDAIDNDYKNRFTFFKNVEKKIYDFAPMFELATHNLIKREEIDGYKIHIEQLWNILGFLSKSQDNCNSLAKDIIEVIEKPNN